MTIDYAITGFCEFLLVCHGTCQVGTEAGWSWPSGPTDVVAFGTLLTALIYGWILRTMHHTHKMTALLELHTILNSDEVRIARESVYTLADTTEPLTGLVWNCKIPTEIDKAATAFDLLGKAVDLKVIKREDARALWGPAIDRIWAMAKPYAYARRGKDLYQEYWKPFERLVEN